MGKVKQLELWWQLYRTSFPVWDLENFRQMDFCWHECTLMTISRCVILRMGNVLDKSCREHQNTHFLFSNFFSFFRKSCRLRGNVEKYARARRAIDDNMIRRMLFACWITKATNIHSEYVTHIDFPRQHRLCERVSMLRSAQNACLFFFSWVLSFSPVSCDSFSSPYSFFRHRSCKTQAIKEFAKITRLNCILITNFCALIIIYS